MKDGIFCISKFLYLLLHLLFTSECEISFEILYKFIDIKLLKNI